MGDLGLRERKKAKTRDALMAAALRLFSERGFDHVTVEEIAAECDVSPRTFFRYFASKEDVLFGDADVAREQLLAALRDQPADVSLLEALEAAVSVVAVEFGREREALLQRKRVLRATPSLHGRAVERHHRWEDEVIAEARQSGRAERTSELDLRLAVASTATALHVATDLWVDGGGRDDLPTLLTEVMRRVRHGLDAPT